MVEPKEIFIRLDRCVGCHTCELACATEHSAGKQLFAAIFETPRPVRRLYVEDAVQFKVPVLCRHCQEAACVLVCPTKANYHDDLTGLVRHESGKCIGCLLCIQACPFGVMGRQIETRMAVKCDRCPDRMAPACVDSCPTKALIYAEPGTYTQAKRRTLTEALVSVYRAKEE